MQVTNLIQQIGKCRDLLQEKNYNKIVANLYLFEIVNKQVRIQVDKYLKNKNHELDFTHYDLDELSEEILEYVENFPKEFNAECYLKELEKYEKITNKELTKINQLICDKSSVDSILRHCQRVLVYCSFNIQIWDMSKKETKFDIYNK